ncbi:NAD-dependent DNA ligase LigA [Streptomyces sp. SID3343]|uniref:NAD-dependent DNA ligase LigA n=1 Tax=Streptomyces sp. SID3343 TaxID=2690260 RepID=UPI00136926EF|nr:NAD-dependent DNA ligase LigA [Streptomyces sp. SID3343]MYW02440.1 NAD-dependent DNA ligase LigA [Streptomyces sp. SID3343]
MTETSAPAAVLADFDAYTQAVETVTSAARAYYGGAESTVDDDTYDRLLRGIGEYESAYPEHVSADSPVGKVAAGALATGDVRHTVPMLSLDNVFDPEGLAAWAASLGRRLGRPAAALSVEPKMDGLAVAVRYREGRLEQLVTRGDGIAGEDVSHAIGTIEGLPDRLPEPVSVEVRGEVLLTAEQFEQANEIRREYGAPVFSNPRSGAAGTLRAKDRPYVVPMTFFGYVALPFPDDESAFAEELRAADHSEVMRRIEEFGVLTTGRTAARLRVCADVEQVQAAVDEIAALRAELPFGIDGIVIKADTAADQRDAGLGSRAPRWAIAYKLAAVHKITRLTGVDWAVGRTGVIAPRAILDAVEIDGSVVGFATLHNPADIERRGLMIGDQVSVYKAGDIIPRVEAPLVHVRTGDETPIEFPVVCPQCGGGIDKSQQRWRCVRGRACGLHAGIRYAVGRDQLDIEGIGGRLVTQLVDTGTVTDLADLFTLTREQLLALDRMGDASVDKLLAGIEQAKSKPLSRVLCALGVLGTGRSMSRRIARHFATMDAIRAASEADMADVEGIGDGKAPKIVAELVELAATIDKLVAAGVNMTEPGASPAASAAAATDAADTDADADAVAIVAAEGPLTGQAVVVTGAMTGPLAALSRNEMTELIEQAGGRASSSVSAKTTLVVAGDKAGSKRAKAESLNISIMTPEEFAELVRALLPA